MSGITDFLPLWGKWYLDGEPIRKAGKNSPFLGKGSFGDVWRVYREDETGRYYAAVKHISIPQDESDIHNLVADGILTNVSSAATYYSHEKQTLKAEIMAMQKLQGYTNIVSYSDDLIQTKPDGVGYDVFLRMELLTPLEKFKSGMKKEDVVQLGIDIATAIDVINKHGLVHRDIKPQNIFVNATGDYKLGDFGTARALKSEATAMSVKGTYNYMSPEVFNHKEAGNTVDIYSLGLVLYRLLNRNRLPFLPVDENVVITSDFSEQALARRFGGQEKIPAPIDADPSLSAIILKCCEFDPRNRWQTGDQLKQALIRYRSGERITLGTGNKSDDSTIIDISFSTNSSTKTSPPPTESTENPDGTILDSGLGTPNTLKGIKKSNSRKKRLLPLAAILSVLLIIGGLWATGIIPSNPSQPTSDSDDLHITQAPEIIDTDTPTETSIQDSTPKASYTISWIIGSETDTSNVSFGETPSHTAPVKDADNKYTYTFTGWSPDIKDATQDATYEAVFQENIRSYTITWLDDTGKIIDTSTVEYGTNPTHIDPVKASDQLFSYSFSGWQPDIQSVTGDATYKATFKPVTRSYTITWQDDTGKTIDTSTVAYDSIPSHADPIKDADPQYTYTFSGWQPDIQSVTGDATYKATFQPVTRSYTITWQDDTGKTIDTSTVEYGNNPTLADPVKESDQQYTYFFSGWQPEIQPVTGDATYTATFQPVIRSYTITWLDDAGNPIDTASVEYGTTLSHADPVKESDQQYSYSFSGWQPEIQPVTGDAIYTPAFQPVTRSYTITWLDDAGNTIDTATVAYGNTPVHTNPTKAMDQQYTYSFSGWQPDIQTVTGDATYKAVFLPKTRSYTITWQDDTGKTIDTSIYDYGYKPSHTVPKKESDLLYTYSFSGWQPTLQSVTGDATYKATFQRTTRKYRYKPDVPFLTSISSGKQVHMKIIQDQAERVTAYAGPGEDYVIVGKYAPYDQVSIIAYFIENGEWVLANLSFKGTDEKMVYFKQKLFNQIENIPFQYSKYTSISGIVIRDAIPRYGPDAKYLEALQYKALKDTNIEIFFMHNGYVFAEYTTPLGKVRMWLPLASVTIPSRYNIDKVEEFVKRCYQYILNRNANQNELNDWTKQILDDNKTPDQVARGFFFSSEFKKRNLSNKDLVNTIYKIYANRDADSTGLSTWTSKLNSGTTLNALLDLFTGTDEFNKVMHSLLDDKVRDFVMRCYQHILNRNPGQEEVDNWTEQIMNGKKTPDQVARGFFFSSEFTKKNMSNEDTVKIIYKIYMNREADTQGSSYWTRKLNTGIKLDALLNEFIQSSECQKIMATIQ